MQFNFTLTDEEQVILAHVVVSPLNWAEHAFTAEGLQAVNDKIEKYRDEYLTASVLPGYQTRAEKEAAKKAEAEAAASKEIEDAKAREVAANEAKALAEAAEAASIAAQELAKVAAADLEAENARVAEALAAKQAAEDAAKAKAEFDKAVADAVAAQLAPVEVAA